MKSVMKVFEMKLHREEPEQPDRMTEKMWALWFVRTLAEAIDEVRYEKEDDATSQ